jgi:hypothetical protein
MVPVARRWVYTGKLAIVDLDKLTGKANGQAGQQSGNVEGTAQKDETTAESDATPIELVQNGFLREVALSLDGSRLYSLMVKEDDNSESLIMVPVDYLKSPDLKPIVLEKKDQNQ